MSLNMMIYNITTNVLYDYKFPYVLLLSGGVDVLYDCIIIT